MNDPGCYRVALERYPGMNPFVLDWLAGDERFLPRNGAPASAGNRQPAEAPRPAEAGAPFPTEAGAPLLNALIASNKQWGFDVEADLRRWAAGETLTIVAGQQVGFAGGPLYTIAKIASLLKMKREAAKPATIFFWLATEDHDYDEVATLAIPNRDEHRQRDLLYLRAPHADSREVVGRLPVPDSLVDQFTSALGIARPKWLRPGITFGDSFAELLRETLGGGFVLIDALLPELRRAGAPLFDAIAARWNEVQNAIASRSDHMERAGYPPQVVPRAGESYTLLYTINEKGEREMLHDPRHIGAPESISTSALTRPLLQDFVLRPDVFIGGPSEVAYYAQIAPLHELLGVPMPRVALRGHVLVAPRRVVRYFSRFDIRPDEVFESAEEIAAAHTERVVDVQKIASDAEAELKEEIDRIRALALPADHAVARSINRSIGHIEYHFRKLAERAVRGLVRKDRDRFHAARELASAFFPDRHVQDRIAGWFPWWLEFREQLVARLVDEIEPDTPAFKIVSL